MKLRGKLALTLIASVVPVALLVFAGGGWYADRVALDAMTEFARDQHALFADGCEENAGGRWSHRRRRRGRRVPRVRFYDESFVPAGRGMPPLEPELAEGLVGSDRATYERAQRRVLALRVGLGPCSVVVVQRPRPQRHPLGLLLALLPALVAAFVALLAAGPIVSRIRRLGRAVEEGSTDLPCAGSDEISDLARAIRTDRSALQGKVQALAKRDETLTSYVANTMHDVMIPLTVLQGHLVDLDAAHNDRDTQRALEESHYIASLLQNLSAAARLEGAIPVNIVDDTDLCELVDRVVARHAPIAKAKGLSLDHATPGVPVLASADPTLLERAMSNLVHNAVRYGEAGGHVAVVLSGGEASGAGASWRFEVLDDGPGVRPEDLPRLGEGRFRSAEARSRNTHGQGLGIAITRDVAQHHGLTLTFELGDGPEARPGLRAVLALP